MTRDSLTTRQSLKASLLTADVWIKIPTSCAWCSSSLIDKVEVRFWPAERLAQPSTKYHDHIISYKDLPKLFKKSMQSILSLSVSDYLIYNLFNGTSLVFSHLSISPTLLAKSTMFCRRASFCRWVVEMSFSSCWPSYCNLWQHHLVENVETEWSGKVWPFLSLAPQHCLLVTTPCFSTAQSDTQAFRRCRSSEHIPFASCRGFWEAVAFSLQSHLLVLEKSCLRSWLCRTILKARGLECDSIGEDTPQLNIYNTII